MLSPEGQSARMSKITTLQHLTYLQHLTRSGTGCFIAVPINGNSGRQTVNDRPWRLHFHCVILYVIYVCMLYYCNMVRWAWWDWELSGWQTNHPPSVLWHCWLGHQTCKNIVSKCTLTASLGLHINRLLCIVNTDVWRRAVKFITKFINCRIPK